MTNTTDTYWEVDGQSLQTYMRNIKSWGGSLRGTPPLRGDDVLIPGRPGRRWVPKEVDSRTLVFEGWVLGADADGNPGDVELFRRNWDALVSLFWGADRQVQLTKRWKDEDGNVVAAVGYGQVRDSLIPTMSMQTRAEFSAPVIMADPFFYGEEVTIPIDVQDAVLYGEGPYGEGEYGGKALVVTPLEIPGTVSDRVAIRFHGPLTNARVWFDGQWVQISTVEAGHWVDFSAQRYEAWLYADGSTTRTNVLGRMTHGDNSPWISVTPGEHDVVMTAQAGTGTAEFVYSPAYP